MKMNAFQMEQSEQEFARNLSYEEWLRDNNLSEPSNNDLKEMEKQHKAFIIKKPSLFPYPINTYNYQPLQGA